MKTLEAQRTRQAEQLKSMSEMIQATETLKNDALGVVRQRDGELHSERAKLSRMTQARAWGLLWMMILDWMGVWVVWGVVRCVLGVL